MNKQQTDFWEEPFFLKLDDRQKLFFIYVQNNSDQNGNFELDTDVVNERIGFTIDDIFLESFVEVVNKDKQRISRAGKMLKLSEKETDPVDRFLKEQQAAARSGNALKN